MSGGPDPVVRLPPGGTCHDLLRAVAAEHGDREAYVEADGLRMTFAEWDRAADGTAAAFTSLGVGPGDVVTLLLPSSIDYAVCYLAAMRLGAVTSGINTRLGPAEVASILRRGRPRLVVGHRPEDATAVAGWAATAPETATTYLPRADLQAFWTNTPPATLPAPDPARPVAIVWTSGTTGDPKGAVFDHRNLAAVSIGAGALRGRFDRKICPTPFSHVGYMVHVLEDIEYAITTVVPSTPWKAEPVLALMAAERVTVGQGVPSQWRLLLDRPELADTDLRGLRICGTGAAPASPSLIREMTGRLGCPVVIGYTSTEAALTTGSLPGDQPELIARTVGRARENVEVRVVDDDTRPLPSGEIGDVECRSAALMCHYWEDPERTADVLRPDGWLRTGDRGWLDPDGYLTLVGRRTEMYLRGGYNVYPVEVERVLSDMPAVAQVAVVGRPDSVLGQIGVAFVVPAAGHRPPTRAAVRDWVAGVIADYKAPDLIEVVPELPLTAMGKVDKRVLLERATRIPGRS